MPLNSLRQFVSAIEEQGELVRISHPVRARLEIAEIADRVMKSPGGGPALLFEHVLLDDGERSPMPVIINVFGSMTRMCLALGVDDLDSVCQRLSTAGVTFHAPPQLSPDGYAKVTYGRGPEGVLLELVEVLSV